MNTNLLKTSIILFLLLFISCSDRNDPVDIELHDNFAIYLVKDEAVKIKDLNVEQIEGKDTSSIQKEITLWLSSEDIDYYDYSTHCIYLKKDKSKLFPDYSDSFMLPKTWMERPFIVTAAGKICFIGYFYSFIFAGDIYYSSEINDTDAGALYSKDVLHITWRFLGSDQRYNNDLLKTLKKDKIFKSGLEVNINSVNIIKEDTYTVEYDFTIKNCDNEDLYVLDPEKTGNDLFHYFTKGISFYDEKRSLTYERKSSLTYERKSSSGTSLPYWNYYDKSWYTLLRKGESIKRKACTKGYPQIPYENYTCYFQYYAPSYILKEDRTIDGKRIWMGSASSSKLLISFTENGVIVK